MDTFASFLPIVILWALVLIPIWRIVKRAGFNPWWSLTTLVPLVNIILLWRFSSLPWPALKTGKKTLTNH
jgi:hypothetical protein